jgi:hypothetical protein
MLQYTVQIYTVHWVGWCVREYTDGQYPHSCWLCRIVERKINKVRLLCFLLYVITPPLPTFSLVEVWMVSFFVWTSTIMFSFCSDLQTVHWNSGQEMGGKKCHACIHRRENAVKIWKYLWNNFINQSEKLKSLHCEKLINRKFRVTTKIGSTFFGCWSVTGQLKK